VTHRHDQDDWSNDSASLFRAARRAHDPTPAESARLAAMLSRIQVAASEASTTAQRGADSVVRGSSTAVLRLVASVSLGVVCVAAASFTIFSATRDPARPAAAASAAPSVVAITPPQTVTPSAELNASPTAPARETSPAPARSPRRRARVAVDKQQAARTEVEASTSAPSDAPRLLAAPSKVAQPERAAPARSVVGDQQAAPRSTALEPPAQQPVSQPAREAERTVPEPSRTELALMKQMHAALREADFSTVLALCAEHARLWPRGVFELEREGVRAIAACGGHSDDAEQRATRFLTAHPHSPVAMRVRAACASQLGPDAASRSESR